MNNVLSILIVAAAAYSSPSNYVYHPIPSNQESRISGVVLKDGDRSIRYEDYAYLNEMISERKCLSDTGEGSKSVFFFSNGARPYSGDNYNPTPAVNANSAHSLLDEVVSATVRDITSARAKQEGGDTRYFAKGTLPEIDESGCAIVGGSGSFSNVIQALYGNATKISFTNNEAVLEHYGKITNGIPVLGLKRDSLSGCFGAETLFDDLLIVTSRGDLSLYGTYVYLHSTTDGVQTDGPRDITANPIQGGVSAQWQEYAKAGYNETASSETSKSFGYSYLNPSEYGYGNVSFRIYGSDQNPRFNLVAVDFVFAVSWRIGGWTMTSSRYGYDEFGFEIWVTDTDIPYSAQTGTVYVACQVATTYSGVSSHTAGYTNVCCWTASASLLSLMNTAVEKATGWSDFSIPSFPSDVISVDAFQVQGPPNPPDELPDMKSRVTVRNLSLMVDCVDVLYEIETNPSSRYSNGGSGSGGSSTDDQPSPASGGGQ